MTTIILDEGVNISGIRAEMALALPIIAATFAKYNSRTVVTSGMDGKHSLTSLHYSGAALDIRTWYVSEREWNFLKDELALNLGAQFDVVLEKNHMHVEFQPKR